MERKAVIIKQLDEGIKVSKILQSQVDVILEIVDQLVHSFQNGNKLLIFGNGGSAADAQHIVGEMIGRFYLNRDPLPAIALTTNSSSSQTSRNSISSSQT